MVWSEILQWSQWEAYKEPPSMTPTTSSFLKMGVPNAPLVICGISNGHISVTGDPIHFMFGSRVGFSGLADRMALFPVRSNPGRQPAAILENCRGIARFSCDSTVFLLILSMSFSAFCLSVFGVLSHRPIISANHWLKIAICRPMSQSQHNTPNFWWRLYNTEIDHQKTKTIHVEKWIGLTALRHNHVTIRWHCSYK